MGNGKMRKILCILKKNSESNDFDFDRVMFEIRKQRFLELVDGRDQDGVVDALTVGLKSLEGRCSKEEFNKLVIV